MANYNSGDIESKLQELAEKDFVSNRNAELMQEFISNLYSIAVVFPVKLGFGC